MISSRKVLTSLFALFLVITAGVLLVNSDGKKQQAVLSESKESMQNIDDLAIAEENSFPPVDSVTEDELPPEEQHRAAHQANLTSFKKALASDDESVCHEITDENLRKECFDRTRLQAALETQNMELCTSLSNKQTKQYCFDELIATQAVLEKNPILCWQIVDIGKKQECLDNADQQVFLSANSPQDCEKIQGDTTKKTCIDHFHLQDLHDSDDNSVCQQFLTPDGRQRCENYFWNRLATAEKNPTICLKITDSEEQKKCESSMKIALKKAEQSRGMLEGKSEYCAGFLDIDLKTECKNEANYYAAKIYRDTKYCDKILDNESFREQCSQELTALNDDYWLARARKENRPDFCEKMSNINLTEYCQTLVQ